ncbi:hypothetical protein D3C87_1497410 [compost metagenome]
MCDPADHVVVLGVHHHERAFLPCHRHHFQQLVVVALELVVGHVDLQRGDAVADHLGQVLAQRGLVGIGQDQMEAVVDHRLLARQPAVGGHHLGNAVGAVLRRERQNGGGAAERGRHGARIEVIRAHHAHARELLDVAMAVDAAGQHPAARGVDVAHAGPQIRRNLHDHAAGDADVGVEAAVRIGNAAVADREVEGFVWGRVHDSHG